VNTGPRPVDETPEFDILWRTPAQTLDAFPPPRAYFLTGLPAVDRATRGRGLPTGKLVVIQGEPESGKTGLAVQVAVKIGIDYNVPVWIYASDGGEEATAVRVGGLLGFDTDKLEARDPEEKGRLAEALSDRRIFIVSDSNECANLEVVVQKAEAIDPGTPHVLAVDSIQETPPRAVREASERDTVILSARILRRARQSKVPWLILCTSEVVKSAFSAKKESQRSRKIAAGAESSKIGYVASMVIHLSGDPSVAPGYGTAEIVKNKIGGLKLRFGLRLEEKTLALREIDCIVRAEEDAAARKAVEDADRMATEGRILAAIDRTPVPEGYPGVTQTVLVRACKVSRENLTFHAALAQLLADRKLESVSGPRNSLCYRRARE
jgi:hypothetical protein